jgi:F-type H+-transporting ATPase subunit gamma
MPSLLDFRRRIRSVKNTQQITKAMKMVAAAKLRRAQQQATQSRAYARLLADTLSSVAGGGGADGAEHPLLAQRPEKKILLVFLSGEKGLCGAFNGQLFREGEAFRRSHADKDVSFEFLGRKGRDFFRRRKVHEAGEWPGALATVKFETARELSAKLIEGFTSGEYDAVYTIFSEFKSAMAQEPVAKRLLPLEAPDGEGDGSGMKEEFIFAQPAEMMLDRLLPRYLEIAIYQAMLESVASEHAARMTAMDSATRNAGEMVDRLTLQLNRIRQAAITTEIIEVVSGAAALQ